MSSVTFPPALGGDGSTVTDDSNPTTGLANGGHRTRFVPSLAQAVAVMSGAVSQAGTSATNAANSASAAATSAANAVNSPGTNATSTSSVAIGTGLKSLTVQTGKNFVVGQPVMIARTSAPGATWMAGNINSYNSGTGALVVNSVWTVGSGTFTDWTVSLAGPASPSTALVAGLPSATNLNTVVTSGFYRLQDLNTNAPPGVDYGQLIVSRGGGDTVLQIATGYAFGLIWFRHGNPPDVGGTGSWQPWRPMGNKPIRYVTDNGGYMYGETQGGLNTINIITFAGKLEKYMPANPLPGDECTIIVANGRSDTIMYVDNVVGSTRPIMGLNENITLDDPNACPTFVYVDPTYGWRLK